MMMKRMLKATLVTVLSFGMFQGPFVRVARADMIQTGEVVNKLTVAQDRKKIEELLKREDVQKEFEKYGVTQTEASLRVASLSDAEVQNMARQMDQSVAGGDPIVYILVVVVLVLLIVYLIKRV